ncbi:histidine phosphatase family protein [Caballeronia sp. 15715]|jgi:hypothetical protein|uniref:histidine phosphatase family protein n=1 Tax=unclassified Caballeronia TaxID=2646786 RepID=UPI0039E5B4D1
MKNYRCPPSGVLSLVLAITVLGSIPVRAASDPVETIIMVRHGEKPADGLGQLSCQGLNRALALPRVIESRYGKPDLIFAPDPAKQKNDSGTKYDYVRPLATIEPTAIYFGLPVNASIGFSRTDDLHAILLAPQYKSSLIVVAWEHKIIEALARKMVSDAGGDAASVPHWASADYDSIYVLRITRTDDKINAAFSVEHEGLNHRSVTCPGA